MKILVTGGSGFIGTNLVQHFLDQGHAVLNIDIQSPKKPSLTAYWQKTNILDLDALKDRVSTFNPTHVVHLAARTDLKGKALEDYKANTTGTENLIQALKQSQTVKRVVFTSTMLVCRPGYIPANDLNFSYTTLYGESKKNMELMIRESGLAYDWCIIRPTSIWGPWFETPYKDFFDRVIAKKMYNIRNRSCVKTYGFVLNSVHQIDKLLFSDKVKKAVYYIGDRPPLHIGDWANQIAAKLGYTAVASYPYFLFKLAAFCGDLLTKAGINFPITSFRLKNMTTDNILPLDNLYEITGENIYTTDKAIDITLNWIKENNR